jgi:flagellar basal body-associated protein FliL
MFQKQLTGRVLAIGVFGAMVALSAAPARAERLGDERACVTAFKKAKEHEGAGKLQESKDQLMSCAQAPCSSFIRQQCSSKYNQLEADTPSVVLIVTDASGSPRGDITVRMDGEVFTQQLDGRALSVDPGMHEFSFAADNVVFATQKIMIVQGQRNRFITALLRAGGSGKQRRMVAEAPVEKPAKRVVAKADDEETASAPATKPTKVVSVGATETKAADEEESKTEEAPKKSGSVLPYLFTGLGVAALGAGAAFTYWGIKDNQKMKTECSPDCAPATLQHVKTLYLASDIALGVGVASLAAAFWTHMANRHAEEKGTEEALRVNVVPTSSGGFAAVSGTF